MTTVGTFGEVPKKASKPLEFLVLDAGALIRGHGMSLYHKAKRVVTVPDVLSEIRDSKARDLLLRLPFEIEERIPSQSSINAGISSFSITFSS
jgi:RNA-binding protein NOB1